VRSERRSMRACLPSGASFRRSAETLHFTNSECCTRGFHLAPSSAGWCCPMRTDRRSRAPGHGRAADGRCRRRPARHRPGRASPHALVPHDSCWTGKGAVGRPWVDPQPRAHSGEVSAHSPLGHDD
jgi:hypothetical protein